MELEKEIYEQIIERLDLDDETVDGFSYDTILFNLGDGQENLGLDSVDALELVTLIYEMLKRDDVNKGLATLCIGGGMGTSLIVEK